jgi:hydroxymethylpyrimidine/phosphomethylpyrimidine kinase
MRIANVDDMRSAAMAIHKLGTRHVVVKGGHLAGDALDLLYDGRTFHPVSSPRIETRHTHGTGCTFASAIATGLAEGRSVQEAVTKAKIYVTEAIRYGLAIGGGQGPTNHYAPLIRQCERYGCVEELKSAVRKLREDRVGNIIPEVQSNFGYALPFAASAADVAAVPGRIVRVGEEAETLHDPAFGASRHIAKVVLAVMSFDVSFRSAMNIRFSEEVLDTLKTLGYRVANFDRADEPPDVKAREGSSLEWGTVHALKQFDGIPDAVFDRGDVGKEPMIRILGRNPAEVAEKVLRISRALGK